MRRIRKALWTLLLPLALGGLPTPASQAAGEQPPAWKAALAPKGDAWRQTSQTLVYNSGADPETLDPHQVTSMDAFRLVDALFEGLTSLQPGCLTPRPGVAQNWRVDDEGLVYTFTLNPQAAWSDGTRVTANDFVASFQRVLTPSTAAPYAELLFHISGAKAFYEGETDTFAAVGIVAQDEATLQIRLAHPCAYFPELLAMPVFHPVRLADIERHGERWTRVGNLVGNGAFTLAEWRPRERMVLRKNAAYWDAEFVKLERIDARFVDDLNTAFTLYLEGEIDWLPALPHPRIEEIRRHPDFYITPFLGTYFYRFNVTRPPFDQVLVRRAFARATDRSAITSQLLKSGQRPVASFCPPMAGYTPVDGLAYDPIAARALLAQAGFGEDENPFPVVELTYNTDEGHKQIAEAVAAQWKRNLGVSVVTRNLEWKVFLEDMRRLNYQVCRASWIGDYHDPSTFFDIFESTSGNNRTGWANRRYDELLHTTRRERDASRRMALFQEMERLLVEDECPILPLYGYVNTGLLSEAVFGWHGNIRNIHPFKYIWLER